MLVHEERIVLQYLQSHPACSAYQIVRACLPGAPDHWGDRILQNLEWLGYITVLPGPNGITSLVQITSRGMQQR